MTDTNNGWPVVGSDSVVRIYHGADSDGATVLEGDVATVLGWLIDEIHGRVEHVAQVNGWRSKQDNDAAGGDDGSNHLSGTAVDINGYKHPYEAHSPDGWSDGWTSAQEAEIRAILAQAGGLFSWGLDFAPGWRDPMHFDITRGRDADDVAAFAGSILNEEDDMTPDQAAQLANTHDAVGRLEVLWGDTSGRPYRTDQTNDLSHQTNASVGRIEAALRNLGASSGTYSVALLSLVLVVALIAGLLVAVVAGATEGALAGGGAILGGLIAWVGVLAGRRSRTG